MKTIDFSLLLLLLLLVVVVVVVLVVVVVGDELLGIIPPDPETRQVFHR